MITNGWTDELIVNTLADEFQRRGISERARALRGLYFATPRELAALLAGIHIILGKGVVPRPEMKITPTRRKAGAVSYEDPLNAETPAEDVVEEIFKEMWNVRPKEQK